MEELSIKIKIADREYPMRVKPEDEARVRGAGKMINEKMKVYREQFGIDDKQDLLAMVAFDSLIDKIETEEKQENTDESVLERIKHLNQILSQSL